MNALTLCDVLKGAAAGGFVCGWLMGMYVGLLTCWTLGWR